MKKIAVDLRLLDAPSGKRGMGYFTLNQFQALEKISHPDINLIFFTTPFSKNSKKITLQNNDKFQPVASFHRPVRGIRRLDIIFSRLWHLAIRRTNVDLIHITSLVDLFFVDVPKDIPSVVTCYDLIPLYNFEKYYQNEKARNWYRNKLRELQSATRIIAISQSAKKDLIEKLQIPAEKIQVIYGGFDSRFKRIDKIKSQQVLLDKYQIKLPFILAQPAFSIHKNVERIFLSFKKFLEQSSGEINLVVVCKLIPSEEKIWNQQLKELGIRDQVILTNFVLGQALPLFYNAAEVLLFPSLYEGFGMPILEAMACGCPVITSNVSSMPEVGGNAAEYVNPEDVDSIVKALEKVYDNPKLREKMVNKGFKQIKKFSWEKCAKQTLEIYHQLLSES